MCNIDDFPCINKSMIKLIDHLLGLVICNVCNIEGIDLNRFVFQKLLFIYTAFFIFNINAHLPASFTPYIKNHSLLSIQLNNKWNII